MEFKRGTFKIADGTFAGSEFSVFNSQKVTTEHDKDEAKSPLIGASGVTQAVSLTAGGRLYVPPSKLLDL